MRCDEQQACSLRSRPATWETSRKPLRPLIRGGRRAASFRLTDQSSNVGTHTSVLLQHQLLDLVGGGRLAAFMPDMPPFPTDPAGFLGALDRVDSGDPAALLLRARYREDRFSPLLFEAHDTKRPPSLSNARDKRLAEFLAGRLLAARALAQLALPAEPVAQAPDRRPLFPHGLSGSISHARGFVACLVSCRRRYRGHSGRTRADCGNGFGADRP